MKAAAPTTIFLHRDAPAKPLPGAPCNGCGVCCAAQLCPAAQLFFFRQCNEPPCPALTWQPEAQRYVCGLLLQPRRHILWLPRWLERPLQRVLYRSIAAGKGCDCSFEVE